MIFLDTNIFLSALFPKVHGVRAARSQALLRQLNQGNIEAATSIMVISELVWFLFRHGFPRDEVASIVGKLDVVHLRIIEGDILPPVLSLFIKSVLDWNDCIIAVLAQNFGCAEIATYDRGFDLVDWLSRKEP